MTKLAVVAIGRNEGERLRRCLASATGSGRCVVYVDSGSTDGSVLLARTLGAHVVELDLSTPFTAARARNAGFAAAMRLHPGLQRVQFVDGDCEIVSGWLERATAFLDAHPQVVVVCGRRREREPDRSIYNALCDDEWNTPIGPAKACGGDALMCAKALSAVAGYRDDLIAGEEPELCVRLRARGWQIHRLDVEMTLHDAAMTHWTQWWQRSKRAGYAFAEGAALHGSPPERHWVREMRSARIWAGAVPLAIASLAVLGSPWAWLALAVYPVQVARLYARGAGPVRLRLARAALLVAGKFAELIGQLSYVVHNMRGVRGHLIEYK